MSTIYSIFGIVGWSASVIVIAAYLWKGRQPRRTDLLWQTDLLRRTDLLRGFDIDDSSQRPVKG